LKLSIESYVLRHRFGDKKAIEMIKKAGFDAMDYSYYWTDDAPYILGDEYREYAKKVKGYLDENELECNQAHAPIDKMKYGEAFDASEPHYLEIVRAIEAASILGAKNIVVHSIPVPDEISDTTFEEYNMKFYKSLEPYCNKFGICVAVENLFVKKRDYHKGMLASPQELCAFIEKLNSPWFVACVDVGHAAITGSEPENFIGKMNPDLLKAVHIQDGDYLKDRHVLPFMGDIKWEKVMSALKNNGYQGELTLEVFVYLLRMPDEMLYNALCFAMETGKYLISLYENS